MAESDTAVASLISHAVVSVSVNLMHKRTRKTISDAPRVDVMGMRAVQKLADALGVPPPQNLRRTTLAGDFVANTLYFSAVGIRGPQHAIAVGAIAGLVAGIGVLLLQEPLELGHDEVNRTPQTQVMAPGMYFAAGVISGLTYHTLGRERSATTR